MWKRLKEEENTDTPVGNWSSCKRPGDERRKYEVESVPDVSSTLSKEERTATCELLEPTALLCSFCNVDFRNLEEENELGAREYLIGKVNLVLADPP